MIFVWVLTAKEGNLFGLTPPFSFFILVLIKTLTNDILYSPASMLFLVATQRIGTVPMAAGSGNADLCEQFMSL